MSPGLTLPTVSPELAFLSGGGEMGERIRAFDWRKTPLGPPARWPQSLKTSVRIMLASRQPIWIGWGPELIYLYNDPYKAIIGGRHPRALGKPTTQVWPEIWDIIGPMLKTAMSGVEGTYVEEQLLIMERHGYREETYYTYSYTPIPDERGEAGGIICANTDDTQRVIGQRQLALLRELASATAHAASPEEVCEHASKVFAANNRDVSFALIYLLDPDGKKARLMSGSAALDASLAPASIPLNDAASLDAQFWPFQRALTGEIVTMVHLGQRAHIPGGEWPEPTDTALLMPLVKGSEEQPIGFLAVGASPRRPFDEKYRAFFELVAGNLASAITTARAFQEERQRAEALAELDRAKTEFFNNVSHEFRTPLTLMLGPIDELRKTVGPPEQAEQIELLHRNSLRLLKMVNTLLEFSRIEAGRLEASFEPTDLATFTTDIASGFRSAVEKAGLKFTVDCPPLPEPVYVDRDMWEKIVLNLVSNALKFTFEGEIKVSLHGRGNRVELVVTDSGVGIPAAELPRIFQRFFRVRGLRSRTHEGTGIGLALVQELARLHGGEARVESEEGRGSTFAVSVKTGDAHLASDRVHAPGKPSDFAGARAFIEEARRWLPNTNEPLGTETQNSGVAHAPAVKFPVPPPNAPRVLLADDNADMREYVARLLASKYQVETVPDGESALEQIQKRPPDLLLTDVMMPRLDGFGLLQRLRSNERTRTIPVIMLSARAGEEARTEGWEAGADDYLIKPFSARELLARVESHLNLAHLRREAEEKVREVNTDLSQRIIELNEARGAALEHLKETEKSRAALTATTAKFESVFNQSGIFAGIMDWDGILREVNDLAVSACGYTREEVLGLPFWETAWWRGSETLKAKIREAARMTQSGEIFREVLPYWIASGEERTVDFAMYPIRDESGAVRFLHPTGIDITERKKAEENLRESEAVLRTVTGEAQVGLVMVNEGHRYRFANQTYADILGLPDANIVGRRVADVLPHMYPEQIQPRLNQAFRGTPIRYELKLPAHPDTGSERFYEVVYEPRGIGSREPYVVVVIVDVTERKKAQQILEDTVAERTARLRETVGDLEAFSYSIAHDMRAPLRSMVGFSSILRNEYADRLDKSGCDYLRRISTSAERLDRLIQDVLNYSKVVRGELKLERVQTGQLMQDILESYPNLQPPHAEIIVQSPLPAVWANPAALTQVISNLLGNAVKFVAPGVHPRVVVRAENSGEFVRFWFEDNGIGISPEGQRRLFQIFQRIHRPELYEGTGIGLAIVRKAAERMGGRVGVESDGKNGSRFWVEFWREE